MFDRARFINPFSPSLCRAGENIRGERARFSVLRFVFGADGRYQSKKALRRLPLAGE